MKTLLLTLVVVTIVCLDLGHTLQCYVGEGSKFVTCPEGDTHCYTTALAIRITYPIIRGCTSSCCPYYIKCCTTDKCND
uniref:Three-finger toxin 19 n=1 Tax=Micrurus tener TaxID=1114301 RepID=A0A194ARJ0_9SAUR